MFLFKRKGSFFLNLDKNAPAKPATVAPVKAPEPKAEKKAEKKAAKGKAAAPAPAAAQPVVTPEQAAAEGRVLTTAEAIAYERSLAERNRPAAATATFAPEALTPGGALPRRRRRAGANLGPFKEIAGSLLGS
jgi:hypothetical protein